MHEIRKTEAFKAWLDSLNDLIGRAKIQARIKRLAEGNPGNTKSVGSKVFEMNSEQGYTDSKIFGKKHIVNEMKKTNTSPYDVAEYLRAPKEMALYLQACIEESNGDAAFIAKALGDIARAKGMAQVAKESGLSRESLYKALSGDRIPGFDTVLKVLTALGLSLHTKAISKARA